MRLHHHFVPHCHLEEGEDHPPGFHHRAHAISTKALLVYFSLFLIFGVFVFKFKAQDVLGAITFSPAEIISLTNLEREKAGQGTLLENEKLSAAADAKAKDMFAGDYWAHYSPTGKSPWNFITSTGYKYVYAGENLARDFTDARSVVSAWMRSSTHKANMLDGNFREIGVAVAEGKIGGREGILVVQMFGSAVSSAQAVVTDTSSSIAISGSVGGEQAPVGKVSEEVGGFNISGFSLAKGISLSLAGFVFMLFMLEVVISARSSHLKLQPQAVAHLFILALVILALWYSAEGAII